MDTTYNRAVGLGGITGAGTQRKGHSLENGHPGSCWRCREWEWEREKLLEVLLKRSWGSAAGR